MTIRPDMLVLDGNILKAVDGETGNGFHIARIEFIESDHATAAQKKELLVQALASLTYGSIDRIMQEPNP